VITFVTLCGLLGFIFCSIDIFSIQEQSSIITQSSKYSWFPTFILIFWKISFVDINLLNGATYSQGLRIFLKGVVFGILWCTPKLLDRLNYKSKVKIIKGWGIWVRSLIRSISRVEGHVVAPWWGPGRRTSKSFIHTDLHKPNNKLVSA